MGTVIPAPPPSLAAQSVSMPTLQATSFGAGSSPTLTGTYTGIGNTDANAPTYWDTILGT